MFGSLRALFLFPLLKSKYFITIILYNFKFCEEELKLQRQSLILIVLLSLISFNLPLWALEGYHSYTSLTTDLQSLQAQFRHLFNLTSLGTTIEDRHIWLVTLGRSDETKPALAVVAGVQGDDVASGEICLDFLRSICASYGEKDSVTALLDRYTIYILPRVNPDACEQFWEKPQYNRLLNANSIDLDHDGSLDEDDFDDMNGDGKITWMRVADPAGEWIADPRQPELLRVMEPGDPPAQTYMLLREGIDNDNDGMWNEDPEGGVNIDENFSYNFAPFTHGGPHPISERESRAITDFFFAHPEIFLVFTFSDNENLFHPWDKGSISPGAGEPLDGVIEKDINAFSSVSEKYLEIMNIKPHPPFRNGGNLCEWGYYHYGRWSFAAPAWTFPAIKDSTLESNKDSIARERSLYSRLKESGLNDFFLPWTRVDHADFPGTIVEVGGFVPGIEKNPPVDSLAHWKRAYTDFFIYLGTLFPQLTLHPVVENTARGVYRITLVIKNNGALPTHTEVGGHLTFVGKIKTELITTSNQKRLSGHRFYLADRIDSGRSVSYEWLISAKRSETVSLEVFAPTVGQLDTTITLK